MIRKFKPLLFGMYCIEPSKRFAHRLLVTLISSVDVSTIFVFCLDFGSKNRFNPAYREVNMIFSRAAASRVITCGAPTDSNSGEPKTSGPMNFKRAMLAIMKQAQRAVIASAVSSAVVVPISAVSVVKSVEMHHETLGKKKKLT